jgi:lysophospholipase L1-like esterase
MPDSAPSIVIPAQPAPFRHGMCRFRDRLAGVGAIKIVAIGSSTIAGTHDIVPFPQRLEAILRKRFKDEHRQDRHFDVLNRGIGGEEAPDELKRMQQDVIDEKPSVVIWQVGANAAWKKDTNLDKTAEAIRDGLAMLARASVDIILMDPQYVPALLVPDRIERARTMVRLIDEAAAAAGATARVNVFKRFDFMQQWREAEKISFDRILDPGDEHRLHHSDWSMMRLAWTMADVMLRAASASQPA